MEMILDLFPLDILQHSEKYSDIKFVLEEIGYYKHNWIIWVDLKMVELLLGLQGGYTKFPCFICLWDSRAREQHWRQKKWL